VWECQIELEDSRQKGYLFLTRAIKIGWDRGKETHLITSLPKDIIFSCEEGFRDAKWELGFAQAPTQDREELASLLTSKFQTFEEVSVIGAESNVCLFLVRKQAQTPVSSQAA
jgi:hypothetical protein